MKKICDAIARWMGLLVLFAAVFSLWKPEVFGAVTTWYVNPLLGLIMFGMGLTLSVGDFRILLHRPGDVFMGCLAQFTVMPLLAWLLARATSLPEDLAVGVVLVGCCPGGTASNVITYLAGGDVALSVGMTATSTLLAPFLTPLLVWLLAGQMVNVDAVGMLLSILYVVILPIVAGVLCQKYLPRVARAIRPYLPAFSVLMVMMVVFIVVSHNAARLLVGGWLVVLVVMLHNMGGLSLGYLIGSLLRRQREQRIAIGIEVGMQNSGLATSLAVMHFATLPMAAIPGAVFSVWHNISGALLARYFQRQAQKT